MPVRPGSPGSLRARNRWTVLQTVQSRRAVTRADIARRTGLSTTTVSGLVAELVAGGLLVESQEPDPTRTVAAVGRPAVTLALAPSAGSVLGIHLGHGSTRVLLTALDGTVLGERAAEFDVDHQPSRTLEAVATAAQVLVTQLGADAPDPLRAGVAVSAPVLATQVLGSPPMLLDWGGVDIAAGLGERLGVPVHLRNDASLGALAEWRLGAGQGVDDLVYVMLSEGVGAGLVVAGRLHDGATGAAGELGHVTVQPGGQVCRCGNRGCLETVVGARALVTALGHSRGPCTLGDLVALADAGDAGVRRLLADAGAAVGTALAGPCTLLDPRLVVVGGTLAETGDALVSEVRTALHRALPPVSNRDVRVVHARLGRRAEALGAALMAATAAGSHLARLAGARAV
jgi:predicted NBD/HSP70 family sugar kinase